MGDVPPGITYFPHVALGNGFVPHVFANDMAALLVWPVSIGDDVGNAVRNLVAVNDYLRRTEPEATIGMILLVCSGRVPDVAKWQAQGVCHIFIYAHEGIGVHYGIVRAVVRGVKQEKVGFCVIRYSLSASISSEASISRQ